MKVLVTGSRRWLDVRTIQDRLADLPKHAHVIVGDAGGADSITRTTCNYSYIDHSVYFARWASEGRGAGIRRNLRMLDEQPDLVLAFWDGFSPGTKHTIDEATRRGIPVEVIEERKQ